MEKNDGFQFSKKKNQLIETEYTTGAIKNEVRAWSPIIKSYVLYCPTATLREMRLIKLWAKDYGRLISSDEADVFYEILDVEIDRAPIDDIAGYRVTVQFTTEPFGYEIDRQEVTLNDGDTIMNHTNAPMFPRITIFGNSSKETSLTIGNQTIYLKKLSDRLTIESKPLEQDVFDSYDRRANSIMRGDFFEIPEGSENKFTFGSGIESVKMLSRWGWL